jgi:hypothetical protein
MRRLLLAVSILLAFANCKRAALPVAGAVVATTGLALAAPGNGSSMSVDNHDSHSWQIEPPDTSGAGAVLVATGVVMLFAGVIMAANDHDRDQDREARAAQDAELEAWRLRMNAARRN